MRQVAFKQKKKTQRLIKSDIVISYKICTYRLRFRFLQEKNVTEYVWSTVPWLSNNYLQGVTC